MFTVETIKKYIGREVIYFHSNGLGQKAIIKDVDELGWTFELIHSTTMIVKDSEKKNDIMFVNHAHPIHFEFTNDGPLY